MNTFILIVLGQIVSLFGNAALRFALPLYLVSYTHLTLPTILRV